MNRFAFYSSLSIELLPFHLIQVCLGAPSTFSDATIQEIRNDLGGLPGMHTKAIEDIVITLKKFEDDPVNIHISPFTSSKFYLCAKIETMFIYR